MKTEWFSNFPFKVVFSQTIQQGKQNEPVTLENIYSRKIWLTAFFRFLLKAKNHRQSNHLFLIFQRPCFILHIPERFGRKLFIMKKPQRFSQTLSPQGGKRIDARGLAKNSLKFLRTDFLPTLRQRGILRHSTFSCKNRFPLFHTSKQFLRKGQCRKNARCRTSTLFRHFISPLPQPLAPRRGE